MGDVDGNAVGHTEGAGVGLLIVKVGDCDGVADGCSEGDTLGLGVGLKRVRVKETSQ